MALRGEFHPHTSSLTKKNGFSSVSEWSPADDRLAVAANNKVELLSWTGADLELVLDTSLRAHTRAVTDITWHARDKQV